MGKPKENLIKRIGNPLFHLILAIIAGSLLAWSLPPKNTAFAAWVFLVPLFVAAARSGRLVSIGLGLVAAAITCLVVTYPWRNIEQLGNPAAAFAILGLVMGVAAAGFSWSAKRFNILVVSVFTACLGTMLEYGSQWVFPVNMAVVHHLNIQLLQMASVTGVWGLSFLVWFANASAAAAVLKPRSAHFVALPVVLVIVLYAWGTDRAVVLPPASRVKVAVVQGKSLFDLAQATKEAAARGAQAVCWPELALDNLTQGVNQVSKELGVTIIAGFVEPRDSGKPYNSAAVINKGKYLGAARKIHLLGKEHSQFAAGEGTTVFTPKGFPQIGAAICYDTNFTGVTRNLVMKGAKVIFVPNSDPVTSSGILHHLHAALLSIRAAENSVVIVRSDSTGLSRIIHPTGWITTELPMNYVGQVTGEIILGSGPTIFTRTGDWFAWLSIIVVAAVILSTFQKRN